MKRLFLLLTFLIPLISFGQNKSDNVNWCGLSALQQNELQADLNGPYTPYNELEYKVIPVVMRGINYYQGQFDDYATSIQLADTLIHLLNQYFSQGFDVYSESGAATPVQPNSKFYFVRADKDSNCNQDNSIFWQSHDALGQSFYDNNMSQYLYEPYENLNIIWKRIAGPYGGYSYVNYNQSSPYGVYMNDGLFSEDHDIDVGWQGHMSPIEATAAILAHEVGHWLGLWHTFKGEPSCETDQPNCYFWGDKVCDTYPDPGGSSCSIADMCEPQANSIVDETNFMSYRFNRCRRGRFTMEQISRSHDHMTTHPMFSSILNHSSTCYFGPSDTDGCTDPDACNFNPFASQDDGSCVFFDAAFVCGGSCIENIDNDFVCDDVDLCTDVLACNYMSFTNEACKYIDECGVCGGLGPDPTCGCYQPGWPFCDCGSNGIDINGDGICDEILEYGPPSGPTIDPDACVTPTDIALSLDFSGSLIGLGENVLPPNVLNSLNSAREVVDWLYPVIKNGQVRISLNIWSHWSYGAAELPPNEVRRQSKTVMPLQGGQGAWDLINAIFDYLYESADNYEQITDEFQPIGNNTDPTAMFSASYASLMETEFYNPGTIKNILCISDAMWHDAGCLSGPGGLYFNAKLHSEQIQDGTYHDMYDPNYSVQIEEQFDLYKNYSRWPIWPNDESDPTQVETEDSVKVRILGLGILADKYEGDPWAAQECWYNNRFQSFKELCSPGCIWPAYELDDISILLDSLEVVCDEDIELECPLTLVNPEDGQDCNAILGIDLETNSVTLDLHHNDSIYFDDYSFEIKLLDGTWYQYLPSEVDLEILPAPECAFTHKARFSFSAPLNTSYTPLTVRVSYNNMITPCSQEVSVGCDLDQFVTKRLPLDIQKTASGFFDSNQKVIKTTMDTSYAKAFISPIKPCLLFGLADETCANYINMQSPPIDEDGNTYYDEYEVRMWFDYAIYDLNTNIEVKLNDGTWYTMPEEDVTTEYIDVSDQIGEACGSEFLAKYSFTFPENAQRTPNNLRVNYTKEGNQCTWEKEQFYNFVYLEPTVAHNFSYVERVLDNDIQKSNEDIPPLLDGINSTILSTRVEYYKVDISNYLANYNQQLNYQDHALIIFPTAKLDCPEITESNFGDFDSEFEAILNFYGEFYQGAYIGELEKKDCVQIVFIPSCDNISNTVDVKRFNGINNLSISDDQYVLEHYSLLDWPLEEEFILAYKGFDRYTSGDLAWGVPDPFMLYHESVTAHVEDQVFNVKRLLLGGVRQNELANNEGLLKDVVAESKYLDFNIPPDLYPTYYYAPQSSDSQILWGDRVPPTDAIAPEASDLVNNLVNTFDEKLGYISSSKPIHIYKVEGLAAYIDSANINIGDVEFRFANGCSFYPDPEVEYVGPCQDSTSVTYYDIVYPLLEIGNRCWFTKELRTTKYNDGVEIPSTSDSLTWISYKDSETAAYTYPNSTEDVFWQNGWTTGNDNIVDNNFMGGILYNWYVVNSEKVCPVGFHVSDNSDWNDLEKNVFSARSNKLSGQSNSIRQSDRLPSVIQALQNEYWLSSFNEGYPLDPTSFPSGRYPELLMDTSRDKPTLYVSSIQTGLLGGIRVGVDGTFRESRTARYWWVAEEYPAKPLEFNRQKAAWARGIKIVPDVNDPLIWDDSADGFGRYRDLWSTSYNKSNGLYIRCVKDVE